MITVLKHGVGKLWRRDCAGGDYPADIVLLGILAQGGDIGAFRQAVIGERHLENRPVELTESVAESGLALNLVDHLFVADEKSQFCSLETKQAACDQSVQR